MARACNESPFFIFASCEPIIRQLKCLYFHSNGCIHVKTNGIYLNIVFQVTCLQFQGIVIFDNANTKREIKFPKNEREKIEQMAT